MLEIELEPKTAAAKALGVSESLRGLAPPVLGRERRDAAPAPPSPPDDTDTRVLGDFGGSAVENRKLA